MAAKFLTRKWRIIAIAASCVAAVILVPLIFIDSYLTPKLSEKLKSAVLKGSGGLYQINFSNAELHVLQGKAVLYDIKLIPDTAVYHQMQRRGAAPGELYELRVKQLVITNAHPFKLYFHKQLDIGQITLDNPQVLVSKYGKEPGDTVKKAGGTLYQKISKTLKFIHVGGISLNAIHLTYKDFTGPTPQVFVLKEMNLQATGLLIDSATQTDKTRCLFCREIITDLHRFKWATADGIYQLKVKSIHFSTLKSRLTIAGAEMLPIAAPAFFEKSKKRKWDRYTLRLNSVVLNNFDFQALYQRQYLNIGHMVITKGLFELFTNPNGQPKKTDRIVTYPNWVVRNMKASLNIDTLDFQHIDVVYKAYNKKAMEAGAVLFGNTTGRALNITNKKEIVKQHNNSTFNLTTYLMGKGKLDLAFTFNLSDATYNYNYSGHLGPMDLQDGNSAVMPLGLVKVVSGNLKSLDFNLHSKQNTSTGKVTFLYNNLKIALLRHDQQKGYTQRSLITLFANLIVIKGDNPDKAGGIARYAYVAYVRPPSVAFFGTLWNALLSGIKPCAGLGKADKKAANAPITGKDQKAQDKAMKKAEKKEQKADKKFKGQQQEQAEKKKD